MQNGIKAVMWIVALVALVGSLIGESRGDSNLERQLFCGAGAAGVAEQECVNYPAFMRYAYRSSL